MKQTYFSNSSEMRNYSVAGNAFNIEIEHGVFPPSSWATNLMYCVTLKSNAKVIDIGTGSGVIAIYCGLLGGEVYATDTSSKAIMQTQRNAQKNGVSVKCSKGSYFGDFREQFDVVTVNLPQEIIPNSYKIEQGLLSTIKGGEQKGNELLLEFLKVSPHYIHKGSKIILPICSLSYYLETFEYIHKSFNVKLLNIVEVKAKEYVANFPETYLPLNDCGLINIFKRGDEWFHQLFIVELTKK